MLLNHITNINNFNISDIDYDHIVINKTYFNIYNNRVDEPLHKFWFLVDNVRFINSYFNNGIMRFALNNKNEKNIKIINYIKKLLNHLQSLFSKIYQNITIDFPWKEYENYPYLLNVSLSKDSIFIDANKNKKDFATIDKDISYLFLFEISYIQIKKIINDHNISYSLKIKLSLLMLEEKIFDLKNYSLNLMINNKSNLSIGYTNDIKEYTIDPNNKIINKSNNNNNNKRPIFNLNPKELLNAKNTLKKTLVIDNKKILDDKNCNDEILETKNLLKKVNTYEKTFINVLKNEHLNKLDNELDNELSNLFINNNKNKLLLDTDNESELEKDFKLYS